MSENFLRLLLDLGCARKQGRHAIVQWQRARFADRVSFACANSPYYREIYQNLPERVEDPTLLPITEKKKLMVRFDDWVIDRDITLEKARPFVGKPRSVWEAVSGQVPCDNDFWHDGYSRHLPN